MSARAAIFDLNGIFLVGPKLSDKFAEDFGVSETDFLETLGEVMQRVRRPGAGPAFDYWEPALRRWGIDMTEAEFWRYWFGTERPNEEMIALAKEARARGYLVFILSNNFKERAEYYGHYPWMSEWRRKRTSRIRRAS
jgi:hypothetical protein